MARYNLNVLREWKPHSPFESAAHDNGHSERWVRVIDISCQFSVQFYDWAGCDDVQKSGLPPGWSGQLLQIL